MSKIAIIKEKYICSNQINYMEKLEEVKFFQKPYFNVLSETRHSYHPDNKEIYQNKKEIKEKLKEYKLSWVVVSEKVFDKGFVNMGSSRIHNLVSIFNFGSKNVKGSLLYYSMRKK